MAARVAASVIRQAVRCAPDDDVATAREMAAEIHNMRSGS